MFHGRPGRGGGTEGINNAILSVHETVPETVTVPLSMLDAERGLGIRQEPV
jgi:hypothetical protein